MSKDMLGPVIRALVGVDRDYLGLIRDVINKLSSKQAPRWFDYLGKALRKDLKRMVAEEIFSEFGLTCELEAVPGFDHRHPLLPGITYTSAISVNVWAERSDYPSVWVRERVVVSEASEEEVFFVLGAKESLGLSLPSILVFLRNAPLSRYCFYLKSRDGSVFAIVASQDALGWSLTERSPNIPWCKGIRIIVPGL